MRARVVALVLVLFWGGLAHAQDGLSTRIGVLVGARTNVGALGTRYAVGPTFGIEAGLMPSWFGVIWSLQWSWLPSTDNRNVDDTLELFDLELGARARLAMPAGLPGNLWTQVGFELLRASVPLEPDLETNYYGPTVRVGAELVLSTVIVSLGTGYGLVGGGPAGLKIMLFVGLGGS